MDPTIKVAKEFPDKHFVHVTGYKRSKMLRHPILGFTREGIFKVWLQV